MGRLDDPFFGFVPPLVSFPPWWPRRVEGAAMPARNGAGPASAVPGTAPRPGPSGASQAPGAVQQPESLPPALGDLEITVDASGQVFLRGVVASAEVAREIEQTAWSVPGVTRVVTQFQVKPRRAAEVSSAPPPPQPVTGPELPVQPPPPQPPPPAPAPAAAPASAPRPAKPSPIAVAALDSQRLTNRVVEALRRRPAVAGLPIQVRSRGDTILLSGRVPTAYEAMIAYRAVQQTPGVHDVVDRLEFIVPDEDHPNPLVKKGRPEDIEPYLRAQIGRHVGELAHIDRVRTRGDLLEVRGTLLHAADQDRVLAILRSIPVLHGFRIDPIFTSD
jgi:hypothetical protein